MSQEALAYRAGVSVRTIARAEHLGAANSATVVKIAEALGVEPGELYNSERPA